jgi:hypothetical protein
VRQLTLHRNETYKKVIGEITLCVNHYCATTNLAS